MTNSLWRYKICATTHDLKLSTRCCIYSWINIFATPAEAFEGALSCCFLRVGVQLLINRSSRLTCHPISTLESLTVHTFCECTQLFTNIKPNLQYGPMSTQAGVGTSPWEGIVQVRSPASTSCSHIIYDPYFRGCSQVIIDMERLCWTISRTHRAKAPLNHPAKILPRETKTKTTTLPNKK